MNFENFFIRYKIGLNKIEKENSKKLSFSDVLKIIGVTVIFVLGEFLMFNEYIIIGTIISLLSITPFIVISIKNSIRKNRGETLEKDKARYKKRIDMLSNLLDMYKANNHNSINLLIEEAQRAQAEIDWLERFKNKIKTVGTIIVTITLYGIQKILDVFSQFEMFVLIILIILLFYWSLFGLSLFIKDTFYREYKKYDKLIYDLRQLRIFYSNENETSLSAKVKIHIKKQKHHGCRYCRRPVDKRVQCWFGVGIDI